MNRIIRPDLARVILEVGVIKFRAFRLKLHEKQPSAPLSPIYLSFRKPPKGPLTDDLIRQLGGDLLHGIARAEQLQYQGVVGVPEAGDPFAEAFAKHAKVPQLWLDKEEGEGRRRIVPRLFNELRAEAGISEGDRILVIDDLITQADSKLEAVEALRSRGQVVEDVLVIVDREQGGREALERAGLRLHAAWRLSELLDFYRESGLVSAEKHAQIVAYFGANR